MGPGVLLVENDNLLSSAMKVALQGHGLRVVAVASSASSVLDLAKQHQPDVALLDLDLGEGPSGLDVAVALREFNPEIGLVLLTRYRDPRLMRSDLPNPPQGMIHLAKGDVSDAAIVAKAVHSAARVPGVARRRGGDATLSDAQAEVLLLVAEGLSNSDIARRRNVSVKAIENMIGKLYSRFGIEHNENVNRRAALVRAYLSLVGDVER